MAGNKFVGPNGALGRGMILQEKMVLSNSAVVQMLRTYIKAHQRLSYRKKLAEQSGRSVGVIAMEEPLFINWSSDMSSFTSFDSNGINRLFQHQQIKQVCLRFCFAFVCDLMINLIILRY